MRRRRDRLAVAASSRRPSSCRANDQPSAGASTTPSDGRFAVHEADARPRRAAARARSWSCRRAGRRTRRARPAGIARAVVPSSATMRSSGNAAREPLDDERLRALVVLGDEVDVLGLEADGRARAPALRARSCPPRARSRCGDRAASRPTDRPTLCADVAQRSFRIQVAVFERAEQVLGGRRRSRGVDVLAIDGLEAELLAEVALRAVGDEVELAHALRARALRGRLDEHVAEPLAAPLGRDRQHAQQRDVAGRLDGDAADQRRARVLAPGITR